MWSLTSIFNYVLRSIKRTHIIITRIVCVCVCVSRNWNILISGCAKWKCPNAINVFIKLTKLGKLNRKWKLFCPFIFVALESQLIDFFYIALQSLNIGFGWTREIIFKLTVIWLEENRLNVIKIIREILLSVFFFFFCFCLMIEIKSFFVIAAVLP